MHKRSLQLIGVLGIQQQMLESLCASVDIMLTKTEERVIILFLRFRGNMLCMNSSFIWHDYFQLQSDPFVTYGIQSC